METRKIYLEENKDVKSVNKQSFVNINLSTKSKLLPYNSVSDVLNLNNLYINERNNCTKYRIILNVNPICTNVLYNARTEVVRYEGGDNAELVIGTDKLTGITNLSFEQTKLIPASGTVIDNNNIRDFIKYTATAHYKSGDVGVIKDQKYLTIQTPLSADSKGTVESDITDVTSAATLLVSVDDISSSKEVTLQQQENVLTVTTIEDVPVPSGGTEVISGETNYDIYVQNDIISGITNSGDTVLNAVSGYSFTPFSSITMSEEESTVIIISSYTSTAIVSATSTSYDSGITVTSSWTVTNRNEEIEAISYPEWVSNVIADRNGQIVVTSNETFDERSDVVVYKVSSSPNTTGTTRIEQLSRPVELNSIKLEIISIPTSANTSGVTYNIPAKGGTINSATTGVEYSVTAFYNNGTSGDVTTRATITGNTVTKNSKGKTISNVTTAGTFTMNATYGGKSSSDSIKVYQQENELFPTSAYTEDTEHKTPHSGGSQTLYNYSYFILPESIYGTNSRQYYPYDDEMSGFTIPWGQDYQTREIYTYKNEPVQAYTDTSGITEVYDTWSGITVYHSAWTSTDSAQTQTWETVSGSPVNVDWQNSEPVNLWDKLEPQRDMRNIVTGITTTGFSITNNETTSARTFTIRYYNDIHNLSNTFYFTQTPKNYNVNFEFNGGGATYSGNSEQFVVGGIVTAENQGWEFSGDTNEVQINPTRGRQGTTNVTVTAKTNSSYDDRIITFYIKGNTDKVATGEIYQNGIIKYSLGFMFDNNSHTISASTPEQEVFAGTVSAESQTWAFSGNTNMVEMNPLNGNSGVTGVTIITKPNDVFNDRVIRFYVNGGHGDTDYGEIYQPARIPKITAITLNNIAISETIPASGGSVDCRTLTYSVTGHYDNNTTSSINSGDTSLNYCNPVTANSLTSAVTSTETYVNDLTFEVGYDGKTRNGSVGVYQDINRIESAWTVSAITSTDVSGWTQSGSTYYSIHISPVATSVMSSEGSFEVSTSVSAITPVSAFSQEIYTIETTPWSAYTSKYECSGTPSTKTVYDEPIYCGTTADIKNISGSTVLSGSPIYRWASATQPDNNGDSTISYIANTGNSRDAYFTYYVNGHTNVNTTHHLHQAEGQPVPSTARTVTISTLVSQWSIGIVGFNNPYNGKFTIEPSGNGTGSIICTGQFDNVDSIQKWNVSGGITLTITDTTQHEEELTFTINEAPSACDVQGYGKLNNLSAGGLVTGNPQSFNITIPAGALGTSTSVIIQDETPLIRLEHSN